MRVQFSNKKPLLAITGHAGCGHCNSHKQFMQDDSVGLAAVLSLLQEATGLSLLIKDVRIKTGLENYIEVETKSGGIGRTFARRGITFHEAQVASGLIGRPAIRTQTLVAELFGRFYGQGVNEFPVALQAAIANAAVDSFIKNFPQQFIYGVEDTKDSCGLIAGTVLDFGVIPVAVLATVNASVGGIGPNEDLEGNCAAGIKRKIMEKLQMLTLPTLVVEGKVYWPQLSDQLTQPTFLVRASKESDNVVVGRAIAKAAAEMGYNVRFDDESLARGKGSLQAQTAALGEKISRLGDELAKAEYAQEKAEILAALAKLVSEDGAGISFMSNRLHEIVGGVGMNPGSAAVLSYVVPRSYHEEYVMPFVTENDVNKYVMILKTAVNEVCLVREAAESVLDSLKCSDRLDGLILR